MNDLKPEKIKIDNGKLITPDCPIIPFIRGDGTGPDLWRAAQPLFDAAVDKAYAGRRRVQWQELLAGEAAMKAVGEPLPAATLAAIAEYHVAIKGPLTTPVGGGIRSLNVALRQGLKLYACVRPVRWVPGVPSPVREPEKVDVVIFRENMEDVYAGIEWKSGSKDAHRVIEYMKKYMQVKLPKDTGLGLKPMSPANSKNLIRRAIQYALDHKKPSVTIVHKGNIMKFTEGAFRDWAYELARDEFPDRTVTEPDLISRYDGRMPERCIVIKDRIADSMFQQVLLRPEEYSVIAAPNLNGDYLSDALAAQVGGLGMAPGANIGDTAAIFEATHGSAPKYANKDMVNPASLILSGALMFEHIGWDRVAVLINQGLAKTIRQKTVTYDLHRLLPNATKLKCSEFAQAIAANIASL
jgi:isocitrate dehydrogenase